jgi:hypothetical protein
MKRSLLATSASRLVPLSAPPAAIPEPPRKPTKQDKRLMAAAAAQLARQRSQELLRDPIYENGPRELRKALSLAMRQVYRKWDKKHAPPPSAPRRTTTQELLRIAQEEDRRREAKA